VGTRGAKIEISPRGSSGSELSYKAISLFEWRQTMLGFARCQPMKVPTMKIPFVDHVSRRNKSTKCALDAAWPQPK